MRLAEEWRMPSWYLISACPLPDNPLSSLPRSLLSIQHVHSRSAHSSPLLPTGPKQMEAHEHGVCLLRSSSSRSDFGPFSALRSFDDADPRELAGEGWDSDADWGFGGPEPCGLDVDNRDKSKPRRQKDSTVATAPLRSSKRRRDPGALDSNLGLLSPSDPQDLGGHQPGASSLPSGRSLPGKRGCRPRAYRKETNVVGLLWRTVDPSLLDDMTLTGDTSLSLAQVVLCLRRMLKMVPSGQTEAENSPPWHTEWFSSAELGFPLVADQFHRDAHPLIRQYVCSQIRAGDLTLGPLLRFRGGIGNDHCEICDQSTCQGSLIICDQYECGYHEECLAVLIPNAGDVFICPKCRDTLNEVMHCRLIKQRPPPPWERYSIPLRMLDPTVLPEIPVPVRSLTAVLASPPNGGYVAILKDPIEFASRWYDSQISTSEGISTSTDFHHPFQIEGARWHLLRTIAGPRLGAELVLHK